MGRTFSHEVRSQGYTVIDRGRWTTTTVSITVFYIGTSVAASVAGSWLLKPDKSRSNTCRCDRDSGLRTGGPATATTDKGAMAPEGAASQS